MYDFLDRPVTSLDHGGRFLVWSTRSWVKAVSERKCPTSVIAGAFGKWDMLQGLQPFLRMMALFNRHGLENFQFCALQCNHVSEHEAIIISLVCALRDERPAALRETLDLLVEEEAVGDLILRCPISAMPWTAQPSIRPTLFRTLRQEPRARRRLAHDHRCPLFSARQRPRLSNGAGEPSVRRPALPGSGATSDDLCSDRHARTLPHVGADW